MSRHDKSGGLEPAPATASQPSRGLTATGPPSAAGRLPRPSARCSVKDCRKLNEEYEGGYYWLGDPLAKVGGGLGGPGAATRMMLHFCAGLLWGTLAMRCARSVMHSRFVGSPLVKASSFRGRNQCCTPIMVAWDLPRVLLALLPRLDKPPAPLPVPSSSPPAAFGFPAVCGAAALPRAPPCRPSGLQR